MQPHMPTPSDALPTFAVDEWVFGWDPMPGIVSVWAQRDGRAVVWRREGTRVVCIKETFRPWLFAATLDDLAHLGSALTASPPAELRTDTSLISYHPLDGPPGSYRYLLSSRDGRFLERTLLTGASLPNCASLFDNAIRTSSRTITCFHLTCSFWSTGPKRVQGQ